MQDGLSPVARAFFLDRGQLRDVRVSGDRYFHQGWYDHATGLATAKKVAVPQSGTTELNLTID